MPSVFDTLRKWVRRATTSITESHFLPSQQREPAQDELDGLIYRLKHWPELRGVERTADVFRALSVMSNRPINRQWILAHSRLRAEQVDRLLYRLVDEGAVEVTDRSQFATSVAGS